MSNMKVRPSPCEHCPFRKDVQPFLRVFRAREIMWFVKTGGQFPCHETTDHSEEAQNRYIEEDVYYNTGRELECAGAATLFRKVPRPESSPIYDTVFEVLAAHKANPGNL